MIRAFILKHRFAIGWIGIAFAIKGLLFIIFAWLFHQNWPQDKIINHLFIASNDTNGYYHPVESFIDTGVYNSFCRMPGLLPVYAPLYFLFGSLWGKTLVILLQFMVSTISVYLLAQTAVFVFKNQRLFYYTFFLYAISTFVSNWDHYGLSDSFGVSFLVYAIYFCARYRHSGLMRYIFLGGLFMAWSVFFRPVHGIVIPVLILLYAGNLRQWKQSLRAALAFCLPLVACLLLWTLSTYKKYHKLVILQGSMSECFSSLSPELLAIRGLIIGWGGDYQPWSKGSEAEWFFGPAEGEKKAIHENFLTSGYNYDSLLVLRSSYRAFEADTAGEAQKRKLGLDIKERAARFLAAYKAEHGFSYAVGNRFRILRQLLLPKRLDDFPTPALSHMSFFHKALKGFYFLAFLCVSVIGTLSCLYQLCKRNYFSLIPLTLVLLIGGALGYVEQRYLAPAFPYLVMLAALAVLELSGRLKSIRNRRG